MIDTQFEKDMSPSRLVALLKEQNDIKRDYIIAGRNITCTDGRLGFRLPGLASDLGGIPGISFSGADDTASLKLSETASRHLAEKLGIPWQYFERIAAERHMPLFDKSLEHFLHGELSDKCYMLRCFAGSSGQPEVLRAFLSDRYKPIDNLDVLMAAVEAVKGTGVEVKFDASDVSGRGMYLRVVAPGVESQSHQLLEDYRFTADRRGSSNYNGDGICAGFVLRNSEVGHAAFSIAPRLVVGACANGMIHTKESLRVQHLGGQLEEGIEWTDETRRKNTALIIAQVRDAVRTFLSPRYLGKMVATLEQAKATRIDHAQYAVKNAGLWLGATEEKKAEILDFFIRGGDTTAFGLMQAVTYASHNADPETRWDFERSAFQLADRAVISRLDVGKELKSKELPAFSMA